jgi:hypothetical protein
VDLGKSVAQLAEKIAAQAPASSSGGGASGGGTGGGTGNEPTFDAPQMIKLPETTTNAGGLIGLQQQQQQQQAQRRAATPATGPRLVQIAVDSVLASGSDPTLDLPLNGDLTLGFGAIGAPGQNMAETTVLFDVQGGIGGAAAMLEPRRYGVRLRVDLAAAVQRMLTGLAIGIPDVVMPELVAKAVEWIKSKAGVDLADLEQGRWITLAPEQTALHFRVVSKLRYRDTSLNIKFGAEHGVHEDSNATFKFEPTGEAVAKLAEQLGSNLASLPAGTVLSMFTMSTSTSSSVLGSWTGSSGIELALKPAYIHSIAVELVSD